MRLVRFTLAERDSEIAVNPEDVTGVSAVTDKQGLTLLGTSAVMMRGGGSLVVKGALGEVCQKLEGTSAKSSLVG